MNLMTLPEIEAAVLALLDGFESPIPAYQIDEMRDLCGSGEPGIALENFATQLVEYEVPIAAVMLEQMEALGNAMGLNQKYWAWLRELVRITG